MNASFLKEKIENINLFEKKIFSQNGEDGILQEIFRHIGTTNRFCLEIGVGNGQECNTRYLIEKDNWNYLHFDGEEQAQPFTKITKAFFTAKNINLILESHHLPKEFDLMSMDVDYNTYWLWKSMNNWSPRIVILEYNATFSPKESRCVPYDPDGKWDGSNYFGASLLALSKLSKKKGYTLIGCESKGINAFFARNDLLNQFFVLKKIEDLYRKPQYGTIVSGLFLGHPPSKQAFISV